MKIFIIINLFIFMLFSCSKEITNKENISQKTIYTSFYPIYFITKSLVGYNAKVINLIPNGGEPHEFDLTLNQIGDIKKSNLIILNGLGIESYQNKLSQNIKDIPILIVGNNLDNIIKNDIDGTLDPHIWLSPKTYKKITNIIIGELEKQGFQNLNKSILQKIDELDKNYIEGLKDCKQKSIITSHEAFGYLALDYGFKQYAFFGISPEEEPSAKDIVKVIDLIKNNNLKYIFGEEFISPKFSNTIKNETQVEVLTLNPLETLSDEQEKNNENYITIMTKNLEKLKVGLECK